MLAAVNRSVPRSAAIRRRRWRALPSTMLRVAAQIRRAIADGEAAPGERLPPAGDLAAILGVNRNTALRALRQLRDEGLLDFRRGRGITVTGTPQRSALIDHARELVELSRRHGYRVEELIVLVHAAAATPPADT